MAGPDAGPVPAGDLAVPVLIVCMGVSGCGKTTLGSALAQRLNLPFLDADDVHSDQARARMATGKALTEAMRSVWLTRLRKAIRAFQSGCVLACSALRRRHRQRLRLSERRVLFLHLHGPQALLAERLRQRHGHFAPASLLDSQLRTLESPDGEPDVLEIDIARTPTEQLAAAEHLLTQHLRR